MEITELSLLKKLLLVIYGIFSAITTSGIIFGFQALKPLLLENGVYHELCQNDNGQIEIKQCNEQILKLNLLFTIASTATNAFSLPIGFILDKYGPRTSCGIGSILFFIGCILFGVSGPNFDGYMIGFTLLGIAGPFIYMSTLHFSTVFPSKSGLIMAALTGGFDSSSAIFLIFQKIYYYFNKKYTVQSFFLIYLFVPIIIMTGNILLMPKTSLQWKDDNNDQNQDTEGISSENEPLLSKSENSDNISEHSKLNQTNISNYKTLEECNINSNNNEDDTENSIDIKDMSSAQQLKTAEYIFVTLLTSIYMIRLNFYISTTEEQLQKMSSNEEDVKNTVQLFNIMLPLAGILSIMPIGWLLDSFKIYIGLTVLCVMALLFGIFSLIPILKLQPISILIFVFMRPLLYTSGNDFSTKTFGFKTFGRVYGLMNLIASIVNFGQYIIEYIVVKFCYGQFTQVNLALTILTTLMFSFPYYIYRKNRSKN